MIGAKANIDNRPADIASRAAVEGENGDTAVIPHNCRLMILQLPRMQRILLRRHIDQPRATHLLVDIGDGLPFGG
jgi:hypothetical protein